MKLDACEIIAKYDEIDHEQWLEFRKLGLGGSDAGAVLGISKYTSPFLLCMEKTDRVQPKDLSDNDSVYTGNKLEAIIRREFVPEYIKEKMGLEVEVIDPTAMYRNKEHPFMIINVDGFLNIHENCKYCEGSGLVELGRNEQGKLIVDDCPVCNGNCTTGDFTLVGLEIKTGSAYTLSDWGGKDGDKVPPTYYAQVQHYLAGTGLDEWWVFGLIGNQRLLRIVKRNDEYINHLIMAEGDLWHIIQDNDPAFFPLPLGLDSDMEAIDMLGNPQSEEIADLDFALLKAFQSVKAQMKDLDEVKKKLNAEIRLAMGNCKYGDAGGYFATYSRFNRSNFDKTAFGKDYPELLEKYTSVSETGRLSVKEVK